MSGTGSHRAGLLCPHSPFPAPIPHTSWGLCSRSRSRDRPAACSGGVTGRPLPEDFQEAVWPSRRQQHVPQATGELTGPAFHSHFCADS